MKILVPLVLIFYLLAGFYIVKPEEIGIVRLFGKIIDDRVQPGIHFALPWPFSKIDRPRISEIKRISVGFRIVDQLKGETSPAEESQMVTGDTNIINVQMMLQYSIQDPVKFLFRTIEPYLMLRKAAEAELTKIIASIPVDEILTTGKIKIQNETRIRTQSLMDKYNSGIRIVAANLQSIDPPEKVIASFKEVSSAKADRERIINEAHGYSNNVIPMARGRAEEIIKKAEAYKFNRVNKAKGEAARFQKILKEYNKSKDTTEFRIYLETMEKILPRVKKYLIEKGDNRDPSSARFLFSE